MDDRAEDRRTDEPEPHSVRPERPATGPAQPRTGTTTRAAETNPFASRPVDLAALPPSEPKNAAGFLPPGAGLIPIGLLPTAPARADTLTRADAPTASPPRDLSSLARAPESTTGGLSWNSAASPSVQGPQTVREPDTDERRVQATSNLVTPDDPRSFVPLSVAASLPQPQTASAPSPAPISPAPASAGATRSAPLAPADPAMTPLARVQTRWPSLLRWAAKFLMLAGAAWAALVAGLIVLYRFADPPLSALMAQRWLTGQSIDQSWVPLAAMSPALVRAVLVSEDGRFCQHGGIDLEAMQTAIERAGEGTPRGASTISMQVAKNLFLWPSKSYVRKALEVPLTLGIEALWTKQRIMEVYLNIAEWGPGVFGAEAAARHHYQKTARSLSEREAALLAVTLPNPFQRDAGKPGPGTRRLAGLIQARANGASAAQTACVLAYPRGAGSWRPEIRRTRPADGP